MILKVGKIYARMANEYIQPIENGPRLIDSWQIAEVLIKMGEFERIEKVVKLEPVVRAGVAVLRKALIEDFGLALPTEYENYVLYGQKCELLALEFSDSESQEKAEVLIRSMMEAMHDAWALAHLDEFENSGTSASKDSRLKDVAFKRLFVPLPLVKWRIVMRYYRMALALLGKASGLPSEERVQTNHELWMKRFCAQSGIRDAKTLQTKLMEGEKFYFVLSGRFGKILTRQKNSQEVAEKLIGELVVR